MILKFLLMKEIKIIQNENNMQIIFSEYKEGNNNKNIFIKYAQSN